jgi:hypothetical protein
MKAGCSDWSSAMGILRRARIVGQIRKMIYET